MQRVLLFILFFVGAAFADTKVYRFNGLTITVDQSTTQIIKIDSTLLGVVAVSDPIGTGLHYDWNIQGDPDGRSVILKARVKNVSGIRIPEFPYPDFRGMRAFSKINIPPEQMELRMALSVINPFVGEQTNWVRQYGGDSYQPFTGWIDFGGFPGGISIFGKRAWGKEQKTSDPLHPNSPRPSLMVQRYAPDFTSIQISWMNKRGLDPGEEWDGDEYELTHHPAGWARGIDVYSKYVQSQRGPRPVPQVDHIRRDAFIRTAWMLDITDPMKSTKAYFRFTDIPALAREAFNLGSHQLVLWLPLMGGCLAADLSLGTEAEFIKGVKEARQMSVDVSSFFSANGLQNMNCPQTRWDWALPTNLDAGWIYHPELLPVMSAPGVEYAATKPLVEQGFDDYYRIFPTQVVPKLVEWAQKGIGSFCADAYQDDGSGNVESATVVARKQINNALAGSPRPTFAGEPYATNLERVYGVFDFTWSWVSSPMDAGPWVNIGNDPRLTILVGNSRRTAEMAFIEGHLVNAMPAIPNKPNGTQWLTQAAEFSQVLKYISDRRRQFLPYFLEGTYIGDSILAAPVEPFLRKNKGAWLGGAAIFPEPFEYPKSFIKAWQLRDRLLIFVLNNDDIERAITFKSELFQWLPATDRYEVRMYSPAGKLLSTTQMGNPVPNASQLTTPSLKSLEIGYFEVIVR